MADKANMSRAAFTRALIEIQKRLFGQVRLDPTDEIELCHRCVCKQCFSPRWIDLPDPISVYTFSYRPIACNARIPSSSSTIPRGSTVMSASFSSTMLGTSALPRRADRSAPVGPPPQMMTVVCYSIRQVQCYDIKYCCVL